MDLLKDFAPFAYIAGAVGIARLVWIGFDRIEKVASYDLRKKIRFWLVSPTTNWKELLPQSSYLLDKFFGEKHFRWRCIWRSSLISFISFLIMGCWISDIHVHAYNLYFDENIPNEYYGGVEFVMSLMLAFLLLSGNLMVDFFSLLETRWILSFINPSTPISRIFGFLVVDFLGSGLILLHAEFHQSLFPHLRLP